jgi:hypothetical protein
VPDSDTVRSRLQRLAKAMGIAQWEVVYESMG